jgi:hypothetical protein
LYFYNGMHCHAVKNCQIRHLPVYKTLLHLTVFLPLFRLESGSNGYSGWVAASEGAGGGGNMKAKHFKVFAVVLLVTVVAVIAVSQKVSAGR